MNEFPQLEFLIAKRDIKKADVIIARLIKSNPPQKDLSMLYMYRARTRLFAGRPDDAINDLNLVQTLNPEYVSQSEQFLEVWGDAHFSRFELASVGFSDRGDTLRALEAYTKIVDNFPAYPNLGWIYYQQGRILLTQNDIARSEEYFQMALIAASHVRNLTAYCYERLGFIAFYEHREIQQSLAFLDRALDTFPQTEDNYWLVQINILRSRVFKASGDTNRALESAEIAVNLAATNNGEKRSLSEAILNVTELLSTLDNYGKQTLTYLDMFIQQSKRPPGADVTWSRVYEMRGNSHFNLGQYDDAISDYTSALQYNPDHPWELSLYQQIARCYYKKHAYSETIDSINRLLNIARQDGLDIIDYRVYELLGGACFALKKFGQAVQAYQSALDMLPANTEPAQQIFSYYTLAKELT
jgi:tetratricopeptide (TPR) repeat protein